MGRSFADIDRSELFTAGREPHPPAFDEPARLPPPLQIYWPLKSLLCLLIGLAYAAVLAWNVLVGSAGRHCVGQVTESSYPVPVSP